MTAVTVHPARPLPLGQYVGEIASIRVVAYAWRQSESNPDGLCLRVHLVTKDEAGEPASVFDAIDLDHRGRLAEFCSASGIDPACSIETIVSRAPGRQAKAVVQTITPTQGRNAGKPKAVISRWCFND